MNDQINDALARGLIEFAHEADIPEQDTPLSLNGTEEFPRDPAWVGCRAWVLATDRDRTGLDLSMGDRLAGRRN